MRHTPVLLHESIDSLSLQASGTYVDCTVNRGGHSVVIAKALGPEGTLIMIDLDEVALSEAKARLEKEISPSQRPTLYFVHDSFRNIERIVHSKGIVHVDGILADLGLSSEELEISGRGFSFNREDPLHMTLQSTIGEDTLTARDVVNTWSEESLATILYGFADERYSRRVAHAIVTARSQSPIETTRELAHIVEGAIPRRGRPSRIHPATKTFLAIRMAVNDELGAITELIQASARLLRPQGRLAIITFHQTEDRHVKHLFAAHKEFVRQTKKPIVPSREEILQNPRSRSAQLRVVYKV